MRFDLSGDTYPPEGPRYQPSGPYVPAAAVDPWACFGFTLREREVAGQLVLGDDNKTIARCLGLASQTIKNRVTLVMVKTGTTNRTKCALRLAGL